MGGYAESRDAAGATPTRGVHLSSILACLRARPPSYPAAAGLRFFIISMIDIGDIVYLGLLVSYKPLARLRGASSWRRLLAHGCINRQP